MAKSILFDLDGTITDSGEGIIKSSAYTLEFYGLPVPDYDTMRVFVGPPLRDTFRDFGVPEDKLDEAVAKYRERYIPIGIYENFPYPGIEDLLKRLKAQGHHLFIATSKPEQMAIDVLSRFHLLEYFEIVAGATYDGTRDNKSDVIAYLLKQTGDVENALMVGDTSYDVIGAKYHNIPCIGVSWGYGKVEDLESSGAKAIAQNMDDLFAIINE